MWFGEARAGACPLCEVDGAPLHTQLRDRWHDAPGEWALHACPACELVWREPRTSDGAVAEVNTDAYYTHQTASRNARARDMLLSAVSVLPIVREMLDARTMFLPRAARGRLLDVGCGNGAFLASMMERGWQVDGIEPDAAAASVASEAIGKTVFAGTLEQAGFAGESFTAITMSHVIEHVPDPVQTLQTCLRLLEPGGALYLATPNTRSLGRQTFGIAWLHWGPPRHLFLFNPSNLQDTLRRAGFEQIEIRTISRAARWSWHASSAIRSHGRLVENGNRRIGHQLNAAAFHLREHFLAGPQGGEEVFARAVKSPTGLGS